MLVLWRHSQIPFFFHTETWTCNWFSLIKARRKKEVDTRMKTTNNMLTTFTHPRRLLIDSQIMETIFSCFAQTNNYCCMGKKLASFLLLLHGFSGGRRVSKLSTSLKYLLLSPAWPRLPRRCSSIRSPSKGASSFLSWNGRSLCPQLCPWTGSYLAILLSSYLLPQTKLIPLSPLLRGASAFELIPSHCLPQWSYGGLVQLAQLWFFQSLPDQVGRSVHTSSPQPHTSKLSEARLASWLSVYLQPVSKRSSMNSLRWTLRCPGFKLFSLLRPSWSPWDIHTAKSTGAERPSLLNLSVARRRLKQSFRGMGIFVYALPASLSQSTRMEAALKIHNETFPCPSASSQASAPLHCTKFDLFPQPLQIPRLRTGAGAGLSPGVRKAMGSSQRERTLEGVWRASLPPCALSGKLPKPPWAAALTSSATRRLHRLRGQIVIVALEGWEFQRLLAGWRLTCWSP